MTVQSPARQDFSMKKDAWWSGSSILSWGVMTIAGCWVEESVWEQVCIFGVELKQTDWVLLLRLWLLGVITIVATPPRQQSLTTEHLSYASQELSPLHELSPTMYYLVLQLPTLCMGNQGKLRFFLKDLIAKTQWARDLDLVTSDSFKQQNVQSPNKRQRITNTWILVGTVSTLNYMRYN